MRFRSVCCQILGGGRSNGRPVAFAPTHIELIVLHLPANVHPAFRTRECSVLRRICSKFMERAETLKQQFGRVNFAYLNAGIIRMLPLEAVDEAFFDDHFNTNVRGAVFLVQQLLPLLADGSSVLFTTAVGTERGAPNYSVSCAAKGAITGLIPSLAAELAPRGIRVNAIRAGAIDTAAFPKLGLPADVVDAFRKALPDRLPMARLGKAEEVAGVAAFLASNAASYITSSVIDVDGGLSHGF